MKLIWGILQGGVMLTGLVVGLVLLVALVRWISGEILDRR